VVLVIETSPDEVSPVSVPKDVTEGCEAVESVPKRVVAETAPALTVPATPMPPETIKAPVPVVVLATVDVIDTTPEEVRPESVPTLVIEVCAPVAKVPVIPPEKLAVVPYNAPAIPTPPVTRNAPVPVEVDAIVLVIITAPEELIPVRVPNVVTLGCEAVESVPVSVVALTVVAVT
jgi:hypothetical protein